MTLSKCYLDTPFGGPFQYHNTTVTHQILLCPVVCHVPGSIGTGKAGLIKSGRDFDSQQLLTEMVANTILIDIYVCAQEGRNYRLTRRT